MYADKVIQTPALKPLFYRLVVLITFLLIAGIPVGAQETPAQNAEARKVRLLIFGNSFSANSTKNLTQLAQEGGKDLDFLNMVKGGCSLEENAKSIKAAQSNPESEEAKFYSPGGSLKGKFPGVKKINVLQGMDAGPWDYVSIQQYSLISFKPESFEPYAKEVIGFIRAKAPSAKILVHQTWAYREDDPLFRDGDFTSEKMYQDLNANYRKLAQDYQLLFLPIGDAFQAARKTAEWTYVPDTNFDFENPPKGLVPVQKGSLNVGYIWKKATANIATPNTAPDNDADAAREPDSKFVLDAHHANVAGEYLGACVWYEFLFKDDVTKLGKHLPKGLTPEQAASLRRIAHETVAKQRKSEPALLPTL